VSGKVLTSRLFSSFGSKCNRLGVMGDGLLTMNNSCLPTWVLFLDTSSNYCLLLSLMLN